MPDITCAVSIWDLEGVPQGLADLMFRGNLFSAQVILTVFTTLLLVLPAMLAKAKPDIVILLAFLAILACTAVGWMDPTIMIVILAFLALLYAGVFRKLVGG